MVQAILFCPNRSMMKVFNLNFRPMDTFGPDEFEERPMLLFSLITIIWE